MNVVITEVDEQNPTDAEVEFLFKLAGKGNYAALRGLEIAYRNRDWSMDPEIDSARVLEMLNFILERRGMVA